MFAFRKIKSFFVRKNRKSCKNRTKIVLLIKMLYKTLQCGWKKSDLEKIRIIFLRFRVRWKREKNFFFRSFFLFFKFSNQIFLFLEFWIIFNWQNTFNGYVLIYFKLNKWLFGNMKSYFRILHPNYFFEKF